MTCLILGTAETLGISEFCTIRCGTLCWAGPCFSRKLDFWVCEELEVLNVILYCLCERMVCVLVVCGRFVTYILRRMTGWVSDDLENMWKEAVVA